MHKATLLFMIISFSVQAQSDLLDPTFDSDGWATTNTGPAGESYAIAVQENGRIVVGGAINEHFGLVRYMPDGTLDQSFGTNGKVESQFASARGVDLAIQPDGKIVLAGEVYGESFVVARYDANGALDPTFSSDGWATTNIDQDCVNSSARALTLQPDGRILLAGSGQFGSQQDMAFARFNADGALDDSFGGDGTVVLSWGSNDDVATDVVVQSDGRILVTGVVSSAQADAAIVRMLADGGLDNTFGTNGLVVTDLGGTTNTDVALGLDLDGNILAVGSVSTGFGGWAATVTRYLPDGTLDPAFGTNGSTTTPVLDWFDPMSVLVDAQQRVVIGGRATSFAGYPQMAIMRYLSDGTLDASFAEQGAMVASFGIGMNDEARSMCFDAQGRLLVTGVHIYNVTADNAFFAARFLVGQSNGIEEPRQGLDLVQLQQSSDAGMFTLRSLDPLPISWSLIDPLGRCMRFAQRIGPFATIGLDLRTCATGAYCLVATNGVERRVIKLMVRH